MPASALLGQAFCISGWSIRGRLEMQHIGE
jgi:hypothetical protein